MSRRHIAGSRCFCKCRARLLREQSRPLEGIRKKKKCKFEKVWYLVERRSATQKNNPLVVRILVSSHLNYYFILLIFLIGTERVWGVGSGPPPDPPPGSATEYFANYRNKPHETVVTFVM